MSLLSPDREHYGENLASTWKNLEKLHTREKKKLRTIPVEKWVSNNLLPRVRVLIAWKFKQSARKASDRAEGER